MSDSLVVEASQLTKTYKQGKLEVQALRGVDLSVAPGEFVVLAGPSGSGKTTLLNLIGALDQPTSGRLVVDGKNLETMNRAELARLRRDRVGFIFQAYNLLPVLTARENTELVLMLRGSSVAERHAKAAQMLSAVGLGTMMDHRPNELSGGQQQRVANTQTNTTTPTHNHTNKPTANLDSKTADALLDLMSD